MLCSPPTCGRRNLRVLAVLLLMPLSVFARPRPAILWLSCWPARVPNCCACSCTHSRLEASSALTCLVPNSHCTKLIGLFFCWVPVAGPRTYAATAWLSGLFAPKAHSMRRYGTAAGIGKDARREGRGHSWRQSIRGNNVRGADLT